MSTPTELTVQPLSGEEQSIVDKLLSSKDQVVNILPDDMPGEDLWKTLGACCKSMLTYRKNISTLKPLIGRMLLIVQDHPQIYKSLGYNTFDQFITDGLYSMLGVARSEAYAAKRLVERWPSLSVEDFKNVTYSKLTAISQITSEDKPDANEWLREAQDSTLEELKVKIANRNNVPTSAITKGIIEIFTTKEELEFWHQVCANPKVLEMVGSGDPGVIFTHALDLLWSEAESK